jgi:hypothetical protein
VRRSEALLVAGAAALVASAALAGCAPALRPAAPGPALPATDAAALAAEVHALARRIEGEPDAGRRAGLAAEAVAAGQRCQQADPGSAPCDYALGVALGLQARERPSTVKEGLAKMAELLRRAAASEPGLDRAGPDRVLALLLVRAPGWPLGPGDPEEGLAAARRAADRAPDHAPNQLALAEALAASGDDAGAREAARRALGLARAAEAAGEPDAPGWGRQARALGGGD